MSCRDSDTKLEFKPINGNTWSIGSNYIVDVGTPDKSNGSLLIYPFFYETQGVYKYIRGVHSNHLHNNRDVVIYLPPSWVENGLRPSYPTLVMHDGQNLFNRSTAFGGNAWMCQDTVNEQIVKGAMEEIVIVGIDNTPNRLAEYTYSKDPEYGGGKGNIYLDFVRDTVLPLVIKKYPIAADKSGRAMLGSSLGGLISCYAGWMRPNEYSKVGCMSSSFWWNNEDFNGVVMVQNPKPAVQTFYLDSGDQGNLRDDMVQTQRVRDHMQQEGFTPDQDLFYYLDKGAQHNEYFWRKRFWIPVTTLFPPPTLTPTTP